MCAPFITMLPMPTRTSSSTRAPCRTTRWPTVTPLPISSGKPASECRRAAVLDVGALADLDLVRVGPGDGAVPDARSAGPSSPRPPRPPSARRTRRRRCGASRSPVQRCSCRVARRPPRCASSASLEHTARAFFGICLDVRDPSIGSEASWRINRRGYIPKVLTDEGGAAAMELDEAQHCTHHAGRGADVARRCTTRLSSANGSGGASRCRSRSWRSARCSPT